MGYHYSVKRTTCGSFQQVRHRRRSHSSHTKTKVRRNSIPDMNWYTQSAPDLHTENAWDYQPYDQQPPYTLYNTTSPISPVFPEVFTYPNCPEYVTYPTCPPSPTGYTSPTSHSSRSPSRSSHRHGKSSSSSKRRLSAENALLRTRISELSTDIDALREQIAGHSRAAAADVRRYKKVIIPGLEAKISELGRVNDELDRANEREHRPSSSQRRTIQRLADSLRVAERSLLILKEDNKVYKDKYKRMSEERARHKGRANEFENKYNNVQRQLEEERRKLGELHDQINYYMTYYEPVLIREGFIRD